MDIRGIRQNVARGPFASLAALPGRVAAVGRHDAQVLAASARWLARSREHTNFTYDLSELNKTHLAWWVAGVAGIEAGQARAYMDEVTEDLQLIDHVRSLTLASDRWRLADPDVRLHKRIGWYALVRALRPQHIVETGTDKGLGSVVLAAAVLRNGSGQITTFDVNESAGYLIGGHYASVTNLRVGDSLAGLRNVDAVDFFLHDSLHTREHEAAEYEAVAGRLTDRAVVLSDNAHVTDALPCFAEKTGRRFTYWHERPVGHWYPGGGIGLAQ